jgi:hypothetical protein
MLTAVERARILAVERGKSLMCLEAPTKGQKSIPNMPTGANIDGDGDARRGAMNSTHPPVLNQNFIC